jgi:hypothetical protein
MALSANTWYNVSFAALTDPDWAVPNQSIPGMIVDAIIGATTLKVFCLSAGTVATVAFNGGIAMIPDAVMTPSGAVTMDHRHGRRRDVVQHPRHAEFVDVLR